VNEVASKLFVNLKIAKQLIELRGGKFMAVLQPVVYVGNPRRDYLQKYLNGITDDRGLNFINLYNAYERNKDFSTLLDLKGTLNTRSNIYIDECHINALGNSIIASKIDSVSKLSLF
jgi:hypothetical protein